MNPSEIRSAIKFIRQKIKEQSDYVPIGVQQRGSQRIPPIKDPIWISNASFPAPRDDDLRQALFEVIEHLGDGTQQYTKPNHAEAVEAEWVGYRRKEPLTDHAAGDDRQNYEGMMRDVSNDKTTVYIHGGNFYRGSASASRPVTTKLARLTGSRILAIHYRIPPQHPFPSGLLDLLTVYLSLIQPPPSAASPPILPSSIIITGESSGANLTLSLLLILLHLHNTTRTIIFNAHPLLPPLPLRIVSISAYADLTLSLPSTTQNLPHDVIVNTTTNYAPNFPADDLWPSHPPRGDIYCDASLLDHPLGSPAAATAESWRGAPPMLLLCGEELLSDGNKLIARNAASTGVQVRWREYGGMPHLFLLILPRSRQARAAWGEWARFLTERGGSGGGGGGGGGSEGVFLDMEEEDGRLVERKVEVGGLISLGLKEVRALMRRRRMERRIWTGGKGRAKL